MKTFTNATPAKKDQVKFPDIHKIKCGDTVIAQTVNAPRQGTGQLAGKTVVDCLILGVSKTMADVRSIVWPRPNKFPIPPLATPFRLKRTTEGGIIDGQNVSAEYELGIAETPEEAKQLWGAGI